MSSRSIRVVALAIAIVTVILFSVPMVSAAVDQANEIASRSSVSANDVQIAKRDLGVSVTGRNLGVSVTGRNLGVSVTGRNLGVSVTGRSVSS